MAIYSTIDWYDTPRYYDIIFDEGTDEEVAFLEAALLKHGRLRSRTKGPRVLEPACGSGRLVAALAERGHRVVGFDASAAMLDYARERVPDGQAKLVEARLESFEIAGPFDLAHCLVSTFKYLLTEKDAREHLRRVAGSLSSGGIYVLGLHLTDYQRSARSRERWVAKRRGTEVVCNIQAWPADPQKRLERVRSRLVVKERGGERRFETVWNFRTYQAAELLRLLRSVPEFEHVATYDFHYDIHDPREFSDELEDCILILRRR